MHSTNDASASSQVSYGETTSPVKK